MALRTIKAEIAGTIIALAKQAGDMVEMDGIVLFMESMKMEMPVTAPASGRIVEIAVTDGDTVTEGQVLARIET